MCIHFSNLKLLMMDVAFCDGSYGVGICFRFLPECETVAVSAAAK